ncbi:hypothetical protein F0562_001795 [Nyssa sinensis]|uniref:Uncharacterized protein n=1 Tax=Nyssa sinensis TaxID=561372 RepID=A0A5J5C954_9ASTE|nr:hypothetical protein F0562_001795 [Nyssa sinensis]
MRESKYVDRSYRFRHCSREKSNPRLSLFLAARRSNQILGVSFPPSVNLETLFGLATADETIINGVALEAVDRTVAEISTKEDCDNGSLGLMGKAVVSEIDRPWEIVVRASTLTNSEGVGGWVSAAWWA